MEDALIVLAGRVSTLDAVLIMLGYFIMRIITTKSDIKRATAVLAIKILGAMSAAAFVGRGVVIALDYLIKP